MRLRRGHFWLFGLALGVLLVALWFAPVRVYGPSMAPTLVEGDLLLTEPLWLAELERYDLVICEEPDTGDRVVKRVAGLPGEEVQLIDGDLFVDGARRARPVQRAADLVPLLNADGPELDRWFDLTGGGFRAGDGAWELDGAGCAPLRQPPRIGARPAVDLGVEVEFELLDDASRLELTLQESGARFVLVVEQSGTKVRLERREGLEPPQVLLAAERPAPDGRVVVFLANVDERLTVTWDGELLFPPLPYAPPAALPMEGVPAGLHLEHALVGGQGPLRLWRVRLGRDLYFEAGGVYGGASALQLGEDEYFLLGDNSDASRDSRGYGPVPSARLRGRVIGRLWPPGGIGFGW